MSVKLIAGLGNPGDEYANTRHNAGFLTLDKLAEDLGARYWKTEDGALVAHVSHGEDELLLVKPQSFMNTSGGPISKITAKHKIKPEEVLVIHDELDIDPGTIRVKVGGGHGGHNGLKSIHAKLGSNAYTRVRVGIGRPPGRKPVADFVLQVPKGEDAQNLEHATAIAADAVRCVLDEDVTTAMNRFN